MTANMTLWLIAAVIAVVGCPLLPGVINRTKAKFAGRHGAPLLQLYWDLARLARKSSIRSTTACGWVRLSPLVAVSGTLVALLLLPLGLADSPLSFSCDVILFLYLLGSVRLVTVLGALDTGSSFEGMGASREVQFAALAEVATLGIVIFLAILTKTCSLNGMLNSADARIWTGSGASMLLAAIAFFMVLLCENCRVPFDDPETHLELTMIHEAMILDNGGPDLALIHYGAALKIWLFAAFFVSMTMPTGLFAGWLGLIAHTIGILIVAVLIGVIESIMARCRFFKTPQLLISAFGMSVAAILLFLVFHY